MVPMQQLNYHHLQYFWMVAKEGSITQAAKKLRVSQPTVSAQLAQLEENMQVVLFTKAGRGLRLTDTGKVVFRYAQDIFSTGEDLLHAMESAGSTSARRLHIGVAMVIPKLVASRLIEITLQSSPAVVPICTEDNLEQLLAKLSVHELDVVLSDSPIPPLVNVKAYNHRLGQSGISFCVAKSQAKKYKDFPSCLDHQPMLMPTEGTMLRRSLEQWFENHQVQPHIKAEFQDTALLKVFGQQGHGVFPVPTLIDQQVEKQYNVKVIGRTKEIMETYYAISVERKISHPAVQKIAKQAIARIFDPKGGSSKK
jgi:LysR family transcriptional activator of nhaA